MVLMNNIFHKYFLKTEVDMFRENTLFSNDEYQFRLFQLVLDANYHSFNK
jgi:hypothetical protein